MRQKLTSGYGERLQRALLEGPRPMSIRQLGAEMEHRHPEMRGATYGGVRQYAAGNIANPRVELLRAIADVLGVRADWLVFGEGEMTEEEEAARVEVEERAAVAGTKSPQEVERERAVQSKLALLWAMGALPDRVRIDGSDDPTHVAERMHAFAQRVNLGYVPPWLPALAEVRARYGRATIDDAALGRALGAVLEALGLDPAAGVDSTYRTQEWLDDYIAGMVPVLLALAPERSRRRAAAAQDTEQEDTDG